jgi:dihydrofolate reductase
MNLITVVDRNWAIGKDGRLLFSLPSDMKRFRAITTGGTVLMGRKTLESFPGGRPLPKRRNLVLSSKALQIEGVEVYHTLDALCAAASSDDPEHVFVIGGGSVYAALLPRCRRVFLTKVEDAASEPDTYFPNLDALPEWSVESVSEPVTDNGVTFRFVNYVNKKNL